MRKNRSWSSDAFAALRSRSIGLMVGAGIVLGAAGLCMGPIYSAAADESPDVIAYNQAVASGDPVALRTFVLTYPTSPFAQEALAKLQQYCAQQPTTTQPDEVCDLETLIIPAAGTVIDAPGSTPPGGSPKNNASGS